MQEPSLGRSVANPRQSTCSSYYYKGRALARVALFILEITSPDIQLSITSFVLEDIAWPGGEGIGVPVRLFEEKFHSGGKSLLGGVPRLAVILGDRGWVGYGQAPR